MRAAGLTHLSPRHCSRFYHLSTCKKLENWFNARFLLAWGGGEPFARAFSQFVSLLPVRDAAEFLQSPMRNKPPKTHATRSVVLPAKLLLRDIRRQAHNGSDGDSALKECSVP